MKKKIIIILSIIVAFILGGVLSFIAFKDKGLSKLPKPELTGGERGSLGIDKNINEQTIDKYLNRSDKYFKEFEKEVKDMLRQNLQDRIKNALDTIEMFENVISTLK